MARPSDPALWLWRLAGAALLAQLLVACTIQVHGPDALEHLNNARWLLQPQRAVFVEHRPPTLTLLLLPLAVGVELGLSAERALMAGRVLSVLAVALAACGAARAVARPRRAAALAALLVAGSPLLVALAPALSHDALSAGGSGLALWLYARFRRAPTPGRGAALAVGLGFAALTRLDGLVLVPAIAGAELLARQPRRGLWPVVAGGALAAALLVGQSAVRHGPSGAPAGLREALGSAAEAVVRPHPGEPDPHLLYAAAWLRVAGPALLALALVGVREAWRRREPVGLASALILAAGLAEQALVVNAQVRYLAQWIPPLALLSALGVEWALRRLEARPAARRAALAAALGWPLGLATQELVAFRDPIYQRDVASELAAASRARLQGAGRVWILGGNHFQRARTREAFVAGDHATRSYVVGVGALNLYLRRPVYLDLRHEPLWAPLLRLLPGDVALVVPPIDFRAWPLQRTGPIRAVVLLARDTTALGGEGPLRASISPGGIELTSVRDLGWREVVAVRRGAPPLRLGRAEVRGGVSMRFAWEGPPPAAVVLFAWSDEEVLR